MFAKFYLTIVFAYLLISCSKKQTNSTEGLAEYVMRIYSGVVTDTTEPMVMLGAKIWYKNNLAIEEDASLVDITDSKNGHTRHVKIRNYRFNDLRSRSIYVYGTFSDTSKLISKYLFEDTTVRRTGGWGFNQNRKLNYVGDPHPLSDTVIGGIQFKRVQVFAERENHQFRVTQYFRCDRPNSIFTFDPYLSKKIGCPSVKYISQMRDNKNGALVLEVNFLRDTLTKEELKVFNAWEKYANENPVRN